MLDGSKQHKHPLFYNCFCDRLRLALGALQGGTTATPDLWALDDELLGWHPGRRGTRTTYLRKSFCFYISSKQSSLYSTISMRQSSNRQVLRWFAFDAGQRNSDSSTCFPPPGPRAETQHIPHILLHGSLAAHAHPPALLPDSMFLHKFASPIFEASRHPLLSARFFTFNENGLATTVKPCIATLNANNYTGINLIFIARGLHGKD